MPQRRPTPLLAAGAAALALAAAPAPADASPRQFSIFEATREVLGSDDSLRQSAMDEIQELGATHLRVLVRWGSVVRKPDTRKKPSGLDERDPSSEGYDFSKYDLIFDEADEHGLEVIPVITGDAPRWATKGARGKNFKVDRDRFGRFVEAVSERYGDRVDTWAIWNEPNQRQFLQPQYVGGKPYSPKLYRALYQAALQGLGASGNSGDTILAGETSPAGSSRLVSPVDFARIFFQGRKLRVDGYAHHPYANRTAGPFFIPKDKVDVSISVLSRLTNALDRYSKHRRMPLYITEFGVQSKPDPFYGVSQLKQAEYRSIAERIAYVNPRVAAFSQYLLRDDLPRGRGVGRYTGFESGLLTSSGKKKKALGGYRLPLVARRSGAKTDLWGLVRPADGAADLRVQYRDGGGWKDLSRVRTDSRGYWTKRTKYRTNRAYRVKWTSFTGPTTRTY